MKRMRAPAPSSVLDSRYLLRSEQKIMSITAFCVISGFPPSCCKTTGNGQRTLCSLREKVPAVKDVPPTGTRDSSFSKWAEENGINMSSLSLTTFSKGAQQSGQARRGMTAECELKAGGNLISVPRSAALEVSSLDRRKTPLPGKISQSTWQKLPWYARLGLLIINAKQDSDSPLQPWIARLPKSFDTPFHWTDEELSDLQSPALTKAVRDQRKLYRKYFDEINGNLENKLARQMTYSEFVWAVECVRSRAFSGPLEVASFSERLRLFLFIISNTVAWPALNVIPWERALNGGLTALFAFATYDLIFPRVMRVIQGVDLKRYAMTPGIDFFNHKSAMTGRAEVSFEYFRNKFVVQAGENYEPGKEVFISYGTQSNDSLLQYYGFVEENNPSETYAFDGQFEKMLGVPKGKLVARRNGFDQFTVSAVTKQIGGAKSSAMVTLRELCDAELKSMDTTLEADISILDEGIQEKSRRFELAVRYRKEKKILLRDIMKKLN